MGVCQSATQAPKYERDIKLRWSRAIEESMTPPREDDPNAPQNGELTVGEE